jgi:uncharacterized protein YegP (UPF0339 family)
VAAEVEVYEREDGNWDWRLTASNGLVLGGSQQGYTERNDAVEGLGRAVDAIVNDVLQLGNIQPLGGGKVVFEVGVEGSEEMIAFAVEFREGE